MLGSMYLICAFFLKKNKNKKISTHILTSAKHNIIMELAIEIIECYMVINQCHGGEYAF